MPTFGSLFAGIGGIDLGLERAGWTGRWQVEWDDYCSRVLAKHWPDVPRYGDVHDVHGTVAHGASDGCANCLEPVDLIAGGFPCQPFSHAGKQLRLADDRWLWPEFERCVRELRPRYVLVENVPGLLVGGGMDAVLGGLADLGYDTEWESIPAAAVGAPHLRYRVWIVGTKQSGDVAHGNDGGPFDPLRAGRDAVGDGGEDGLADADGTQRERGRLSGGVQTNITSDGGGNSELLADAERIGGKRRRTGPREAASGRPSSPTARRGDVADAPGGRQPRPGQLVDAVHPEAAAAWQATQPFNGRLSDQWSTEPDVGRVAHGVPARVDRLRSLGNAVVPQVVEWIGRRILESEGV